MARVYHPFVSAIPDDPASVLAGEVVPTNWNADHTIEGVVTAPAVVPVTDEAIARWDGTSGTLLQNSLVGIHDNGNMTIGGAGDIRRNLQISNPITGGILSYGVTHVGEVSSDVTSGATYFRTAAKTPAVAFTTVIFHFGAVQGVFGAGSTVANQYAFHCDNSLVGATNNYAFYGGLTAGTGRWNLYCAGSADNLMAGRLTIGSGATTDRTLNINRNVTGGVTTHGVYNAGTIQSDVTTTANYNTTVANTQAAAFTLVSLRHYYAQQGTIGAGAAVTNQYGFYVDSTLIGGANNYGFYSNIAAGTNRWNFYANGTANNFMQGPLQLGSYVRMAVSTVAGLVAAATAGQGARAFVTDSTVTPVGNFGSTVTGGGAFKTPVYCDGTGWLIG